MVLNPFNYLIYKNVIIIDSNKRMKIFGDVRYKFLKEQLSYNRKIRKGFSKLRLITKIYLKNNIKVIGNNKPHKISIISEIVPIYDNSHRKLLNKKHHNDINSPKYILSMADIIDDMDRLNNLEIYSFQIIYYSRRSGTGNDINTYIMNGKRKYLFPEISDTRVTCEYLTIKKSYIDRVEVSGRDKLTVSIKISILSILIALILFLICLIMKDLYAQFDRNIIAVCLIPVMISLTLKLIVTVTIMLFIYSFIMFKIGHKIYRHSVPRIIYVAYHMIIPSILTNEHKSLLLIDKIVKI